MERNQAASHHLIIGPSLCIMYKVIIIIINLRHNLQGNRQKGYGCSDGLTTHRDIRSKAILHGRKYEHVAVEKFEARWGIKTEPCGIFVSQTHPQLAASPDRIVDQDTVLEVKCPYARRAKLISSETVPYLKESDGALVLDPNHDYHYQIQGQLFCSDRKLCLFVVYTLRDIAMIRIERDEGFINTMLNFFRFTNSISNRQSATNLCTEITTSITSTK